MISKHLKRCEKRERDRQRKWRNTMQGAFEASFRHVDYGEAEAWEKSPSWLSDHGAGAEQIVRQCDGEFGQSYFERRLEWARGQIKDHKPLRKSAEVFELIVDNGENRKESICSLMLKRPRNGQQRRSCIFDTSKNC